MNIFSRYSFAHADWAGAFRSTKGAIGGGRVNIDAAFLFKQKKHRDALIRYFFVSAQAQEYLAYMCLSWMLGQKAQRYSQLVVFLDLFYDNDETWSKCNVAPGDSVATQSILARLESEWHKGPQGLVTNGTNTFLRQQLETLQTNRKLDICNNILASSSNSSDFTDHYNWTGSEYNFTKVKKDKSIQNGIVACVLFDPCKEIPAVQQEDYVEEMEQLMGTGIPIPEFTHGLDQPVFDNVRKSRGSR